MTKSSVPALRLIDVGIGFRGVRALDSVTFDVPQGGVSAVIGPNGAGKTTLFNCVSGIYRHEGSILLEGTALDGKRAFRRPGAGIARTFQTPVLLDDQDVLTNVMLGSYTRTHAGIFAPLWSPPAHAARNAPSARRRWPSSKASDWALTRGLRPGPSRMATGAGSRSLARSSPSPGCSCSMSRRLG